MEPSSRLFLGCPDKGLLRQPSLVVQLHVCGDSLTFTCKDVSVLAAVGTDGETACSLGTPVISVITKGSFDLSGAAAVANCGVSLTKTNTVSSVVIKHGHNQFTEPEHRQVSPSPSRSCDRCCLSQYSGRSAGSAGALSCQRTSYKTAVLVGATLPGNQESASRH